MSLSVSDSSSKENQNLRTRQVITLDPVVGITCKMLYLLLARQYSRLVG